VTWERRAGTQYSGATIGRIRVSTNLARNPEPCNFSPDFEPKSFVFSRIENNQPIWRILRALAGWRGGMGADGLP
jgi:hypothetical protein